MLGDPARKSQFARQNPRRWNNSFHRTTFYCAARVVDHWMKDHVKKGVVSTPKFTNLFFSERKRKVHHKNVRAWMFFIGRGGGEGGQCQDTKPRKRRNSWCKVGELQLTA